MFDGINPDKAINIMLHRALTLLKMGMIGNAGNQPDFTQLNRLHGICWNILTVNNNHQDMGEGTYTDQAWEVRRLLTPLFVHANQSGWLGVDDNVPYPFGRLGSDNFNLTTKRGQIRFNFLLNAIDHLERTCPEIEVFANLSHLVASETAELVDHHKMLPLDVFFDDESTRRHKTREGVLWDPMNSLAQSQLLSDRFLTENEPGWFSNGSGSYQVIDLWGARLSRARTQAFAAYQYAERMNRLYTAMGVHEAA